MEKQRTISTTQQGPQQRKLRRHDTLRPVLFRASSHACKPLLFVLTQMTQIVIQKMASQ